MVRIALLPATLKLSTPMPLLVLCCRHVQPVRATSGEGMYEGTFPSTASRIAACHSALHDPGQQHMLMRPGRLPNRRGRHFCGAPGCTPGARFLRAGSHVVQG